MHSAEAERTPLTAPILCQIRTGCATGSRLVGTIHTRLNSSLAEVRLLLGRLASRARGDAAAPAALEVHGAPVNMTQEEWKKTMAYPLHPFDLGLAFSFVRCGGCVPIARCDEATLLLVDVFPKLPRAWGTSTVAGWAMEPAPPMVKVLARPGEYPPSRNALAVVFIAQGEPGRLVTEEVLLERHMLQQGAYGRPDRLEEFSALLNEWNGNVKDCFGRTVLHECVYEGRKEAVAFLLSLSFIRVNEQDAQGKTPLHLAVRGGSAFLVSRLLEAGADVLLADNGGDTALHAALRLRNGRLVELLCERLRANGVEAKGLRRLKNSLGMSPGDLFSLHSPTFMQLCEEGDVAAAKSLHDHYLFAPDAVAACDELLRQSALHVAAARGHVHVLRFLLDELKPGSFAEERMLDARLQTPLHLAAAGGHLPAVGFLHERFPWWVSLQDFTGATPLVAALRSGRRGRITAVVEYLIAALPRGSAAANACDSSGMGALHLLCELGMTRAANSLIVDHGADVTLSCACGGVPARYLTTTRALPRRLRGAAKASRGQLAKEQRGVTPLLCALRGRRGHVSTVEMLLSHGAGTRADEAVELLFYLVTKGHYELADRAVASGVRPATDSNELLCRFCAGKHGVGIRWCVERGCCGLSSLDGGCPLLLSSAVGDAEAVGFLLSCGADPNVTPGGTSPLLAAVNSGHHAVVERLVRAGARLAAADGSWAALRAAAESGAESVVRALLGLHVLSPSEVSQALVHTMQHVRGRRGVVSCERACGALAAGLDLSSRDITHPTELLHLAASRSLFVVVRALVGGLRVLPASTLREVVNAPPPPPTRPFVLIEPATAPLRVRRPSSLSAEGRRGLYPVPKPFKRLVIRRRDTGVLFHRLRLRDVFSYCAEASEGELLESLLFDVGLRPWAGPDYRGWNAADYAAERQLTTALRMLLVAGLTPLRRHAVRRSTRLGALCRSIAAVNGGLGEASVLSSVLCNLAAAREKALLREILIDTCRFHDVPDLSGAGAWLDELVLCCARTRCLDLLEVLRVEFQVPLRQRLRRSVQPLLWAVACRDADLVAYLILHGAPVDAVDTIPATGTVAGDPRAPGREKREVSPLWLAAHLGDVAVMELLLSTGPLSPERCADSAEFCRDALRALVGGAPRRPSKSQDALIAKGVVMLARAGHVYASPSIMRVAARKGLLQVLKRLIECYGLRMLTEDIASGEICSLHYFVVRRALCEVLRAALLCAAAADAVEAEAGQQLLRAIRATNFTVNPVDYALRAGCAAGAMLLLGLGLCGSGEREEGRSPKISRLIRSFLARRAAQGEEGYTILHAAVELQEWELVRTLLRERVILQCVEKSAIEGPRAATAPSLAALTNFYLHRGHRRRLSSLAAPMPARIFPCDLPYLVFGPSSSEEAYRDIVRLSASGGGLEQALELRHGGLPKSFVRQLVTHHRHSFYFGNRSFGVAALTPMGWAVAAGSLPWVRLLANSGVSTTNCRSTVAGIRRSCAPQRPPASVLPGHRKAAVRAVARRHTCRKEDTCPASFTEARYPLSPALLCMAVIVETAVSGDAEGLLRQSQVMRFLLARGQCLGRAEVNPLAIALARLRLWGLLEAVVAAAAAGDSAGDRLFTTVQEAEVPPVIRRAIGTARHVMHVAARCAPREIIMLVVRHSQRAEIEESCDARGRTMFFHALHHPCRWALEALMSLRFPTHRPCCKALGRTPLMVACQRGPLSHVAALLKQGGINSTDRGGNTPLLLAAAAGQMEIVEHLLANGADASVRNSKGLTAVMAAALAGHDRLAVPLAENFSKLEHFFSPQTTLLHCAAVGGCHRVAAALVGMLEKVDPLAADGNGDTAVYLAYAFGNARVLRVLLTAALSRGAEPASSLHLERQIFACSSTLPRHGWLRGLLQVGEALLNEARQRSFCRFAMRPGEMTYSTSTSFRRARASLLLWCVRNNNAVGVRVLGDMNVADDCGALHEAAKRGHLDVVELLLKLEMSDPNSLDGVGRLPFEVAAVHRHVACASLLLARTKLDVLRLSGPAAGGAENALHRLASAGSAETLVALVEAFRRRSDSDWAVVASKLLDALDTPDSAGMTAFEAAVAMGNPAAVLRVAQVLQRLALASARANALSISNSFLMQLPGVSPAARVLLYDVFGVAEVATCVGFAQGRHAGRLTFADVRLIGANALRESAFCATEVAAAFTLEHEVAVASALLRGLPFRIRYNPRSLETRSAEQRVQFLQWLASSLVLSNYEPWDEDNALDTVEVELVLHRAEEFVELSNGHLRHSVYVDSRRLLAPPLQAKFQFASRREAARLRGVAEGRCRSLTQKLRQLPHPAASSGRVAVEWGDGRVAVGVEAVTRLMYDGLARLELFLDGRLKDALAGVAVEDVLAVTAATGDAAAAADIRFCYAREAVPGRQGPAPAGGIVLLFNEDAVQDVEPVLRAALYRPILADVNLVGVSFVRDAFLADVRRRVAAPLAAAGVAAGCRLQLEGGTLDELPLHLLQAMMADAAEALASLMTEPTASMQAFHSSRIVRDALARSLHSVVVLFSPERRPAASFSDGTLLLCLGRQLAPTRCEIYERLRRGALAEEIERLRGELPRVVAAVRERHQRQLPSTTFLLDPAALLEAQDDEYVASALSLLCHSGGALVLQPLFEGVSIGWDTGLGAVVRRHVRQFSLAVELYGSGSCVLYDDGSLVYNCPLRCLERGACATATWYLLSAQQIASLLLLQLSVVDPGVVGLINVTRPVACWSQAYGVGTRLLTAGRQRNAVRVTTRNFLNLRLGHDVSEGSLTFAGKWRAVRVEQATGWVHFTAPTKSGYFYQHIRMGGQPIFNSPLRIRVKPLQVHLPRTEVRSKFNTVVVGRPFEIVLRLRDRYGNRIEAAAALEISSAPGGVAKVLSWSRPHVDTVTVQAVVTEVRDSCTVPIRLCAAAGRSFTLPFTVESVSRRTHRQICLLRRGYTLDREKGPAATQARASKAKAKADAYDRAKYFFRRAVRDAERRRLARDAKSIGGLLTRVFPPRRPTGNSAARPQNGGRRMCE
ncbi:putative ankyrin repeat protein [Trypanosoma conorhini]|uniref:Putative ankyrin repeat protein n=1 Tax=Trypanosoma conorhini TaxID=83891 RepID=A0A422PBS1_9TRYP|nr:putative ankyrin repeat protein [Trypanosoma conorhini]RNF15159.1 putative ankyrin repeat protein [Trypanosoma conorhini]